MLPGRFVRTAAVKRYVSSTRASLWVQVSVLCL